MRHLQNFQQYGQCYAPSKGVARNSEYPKLCKNPDCRAKNGLARKQWQKHYENFMATGKCHKKRERKAPRKRAKKEQQTLLSGLRGCTDKGMAMDLAVKEKTLDGNIAAQPRPIFKIH